MVDRKPKPPRGLLARLWRLPIWLYRLNLGWLMGGRFLLLKHTGRKTGLDREAVIEVVRHNPLTNTYYVCSAFGTQSDWYRNIEANPVVQIQVGGKKMAARAQILPPKACGEEMVLYAQSHPRVAASLMRVIGYDPPKTLEGYRLLAEQSLPFVRFDTA